MPSKIIVRRIRGVLTDAHGKSYNVHLVLKVIEIYVNERTVPVQHAVDRVELSAGGDEVPDGSFTLTFPFEGVKQQKKVRVESGTLLAP